MEHSFKIETYDLLEIVFRHIRFYHNLIDRDMRNDYKNKYKDYLPQFVGENIIKNANINYKFLIYKLNWLFICQKSI